MNREEIWYRNYQLLKEFVLQNGHLPSKHVVENRRLLNWWKYNQKLIKQGILDEERVRLLNQLSAMRTSVSPKGCVEQDLFE